MITSNRNAPTHIILPHGGTLMNRTLRGETRQAVLQRASAMPQVELSAKNLADLEMLAHGALSPLTGFMGRLDYERVLAEMRLMNDLAWTVPVTLAVDEATAVAIHPHQEIALCENGRVLAVMEVNDKYAWDKKLAAQQLYHSTDPAHPGVAQLLQQGDTLLGGDVWVVNLPTAANQFAHLRHTPRQTRRMFSHRKWRRVVGFYSSAPFHRAHEHIHKTALEFVDGLFIHLPVGPTTAVDIPADVRIASYEAILHTHYPEKSVLLGAFPATAPHAGPRQAVMQAIIRQNYGCTHVIVSADDADGSSIRHLFNSFEPDALAIEILPFSDTFYCKKCDSVASTKTCPHGSTNWLNLNDRQVHRLWQNGQIVPPELTRPEAYAILAEGMQSQQKYSPLALT